MTPEVLEWIGYIASIIIAVSMLMSSIIKFRWINLVGALLFSLYGFFIDAWPVVFLNGIISLADIFYLYKIYSKKEAFQLLNVSKKDKYILEFIYFNKKDIEKFSSDFNYNTKENNLNFLILRDLAVAGIFIIALHDDKSIEVKLDYVLPAYRDFKNGKFIYRWVLERFTHEGYKTIWTKSNNKTHSDYLKKQGFVKKDDLYVKKI